MDPIKLQPVESKPVESLPISSATVRVMKSYDYSHFEITLSSTETNTPEQVDDLRKTAARLADKAVEQYKIAKDNLEELESAERYLNYQQQEEERILAKPETERTPEEQALVKEQANRRFQLRRGRYDYQDDWQDSDQEGED